MKSWWDLGDGFGYRGSAFSGSEITCPFCDEQGHFSPVFQAEKKKPNGSKVLHFDTYKCENCSGYTMVLWAGASYGGQIHDFHILPWPLQVREAPKEWPQDVGRYWVQAHRSLAGENWDAAALMARSALQIALRQQNAHGESLKAEIDSLASKGLLPAIMAEWAHEVRELGNDAAHPKPGQPPTPRNDARDIVEFIDYLFQYLYSLPNRINQYRSRRAQDTP